MPPPCFYHIGDLRRIRRYISLSVAKTIATALITSRLDYCNYLLYNIASNDILKLQYVQNCLAEIATRSPRFFHSVLLLKSLHWVLSISTLLSLASKSRESVHLVFIRCLFPGLQLIVGLVPFQLFSLLSGIHSLNMLSHQIA